MSRLPPDLRRSWLFGPGADAHAHDAMARCGADVLIQDLEDFTPEPQRAAARAGAAALYGRWRASGALVTVRINALDGAGVDDLAAVMPARPDIVAYPMASSAAQMQALDRALTAWEGRLKLPVGCTEILPVCETALGVVEVRALAAASARIRCALLGAEDLANDLCAPRTAEGGELAHARRRFLLECRAAGIEPVDAPYTFQDADGAQREARQSAALGYRAKALVRVDHVAAVHEVLTPDERQCRHAQAVVQAFEAARARGEERALVDGLWVEVPTYRSALRVLERAQRFASGRQPGGRTA